MTKDEALACKAQSAYERAQCALSVRQRIVAEASQRRYYERGLITDNGERGSAQKCNIGAPFDWDDLSALMLDHDTLAARVRDLEGQTCDTCAHQWAAGTARAVATCGKVSIPGHSVAVVACSGLGNGCKAWRKKAIMATAKTRGLIPDQRDAQDETDRCRDTNCKGYPR